LADSDIQIFSVAEITSYIKNKLINDKNLQKIWVQGEISNFTSHSSGHFYFTLKDEDSQLPCAMFRWANENLKFKLQEGMKILAQGNLDVYVPQGRYNFVVLEVHPKGTGQLYLKYMQLKKKLLDEGLFEVKYKKQIPSYPQTIGVVTSPTGAALRDILNVTKRRYPLAEIVVVPTLVQGDTAAEDIVRAIHLINKYKDVDVAIVGRGGGSFEDLWPFNEEIVARTIFESHIPIISAVGHETDFSISDFVADLRAPTPSAAAELVVPDKKEIAREIAGFVNALFLNMIGAIKLNHKQLVGLNMALKPGLLLNRVIQNQQQTDDLTSTMIMHMNHSMEMSQGRFNTLCEMLDAVSPMATLNRGYSIALKLPEKELVDSIEKAGAGNDLKIILKDGDMKCRVEKVIKKNRIIDHDN
jgi:exodeoxyribonuclease VII large subunit